MMNEKLKKGIYLYTILVFCVFIFIINVQILDNVFNVLKYEGLPSNYILKALLIVGIGLWTIISLLSGCFLLGLTIPPMTFMFFPVFLECVEELLEARQRKLKEKEQRKDELISIIIANPDDAHKYYDELNQLEGK